MRKLVMLTVLGLSLTFSSNGFAAGYGAAGCGLGSLVFGDEAGIIQIFAATTNGTSGSQTFGITSGTSNCDSSGLILSEKEDDLFVANNFENLEKEMAVGEGENLETLAGLLGCPSEKSPVFASYAQKNYSVIFASTQTTPNEMLQVVRTGVSTHPELAGACVQ